MQHLAMALYCLCALCAPPNNHPITPAPKELLTSYGPVTLKITYAEDSSSTLRVGQQFMEFQAASLYAILQMTGGYMQACPRTPVDFSPVPDVIYEYKDHPFSCREALYEVVNLYASCSDCLLEELQEVVNAYLVEELWLLPDDRKLEEQNCSWAKR